MRSLEWKNKWGSRGVGELAVKGTKGDSKTYSGRVCGVARNLVQQNPPKANIDEGD